MDDGVPGCCAPAGGHGCSSNAEGYRIGPATYPRGGGRARGQLSINRQRQTVGGPAIARPLFQPVLPPHPVPPFLGVRSTDP